MDKWRCTPYLWITLRCPSRGKLIWHWNIFWKIVFSTHIKWPVPSGSSGFHSISDVPMYNMTNSCVINICFFRWFRCVFPASPGIHPKATPYCWTTSAHWSSAETQRWTRRGDFRCSLENGEPWRSKHQKWWKMVDWSHPNFRFIVDLYVSKFEVGWENFKNCWVDKVNILIYMESVGVRFKKSVHTLEMDTMWRLDETLRKGRFVPALVFESQKMVWQLEIVHLWYLLLETSI